MIIKSLELRNFRNYEGGEVFFDERLNLVCGENGQGKTNLIEAINFLSMAKSFRTRREAELLREGEASFFVKGVFEKGGAPYTVEIVWSASGPHGAGVRKFVVNGAERSSVVDLLGGIYTIVFSPEDLAVVKGGPDVRRRFLDREIILLRPLYYHKLKKYRGILKSRNALLKQDAPSPELLDVYDEQLAEAGAAVMEERASYIAALAEESAESVKQISDGRDALSVSYSPSFSGLSRESCKEDLQKNRDRDLFLHATETGPHRDDMALTLNGRDLRIYGSQGQQRTAALSLRLAERALIKRETGEDAILLLDDVMSELDAGRQERILSVFRDNQVFVTTAEVPDYPAGANVFTVTEGKISF